MGYKGHFPLGIITTLLVLANSDTAHADTREKHEFSVAAHQNHNKEETQSTVWNDSDSTEDIEGAESQFMPSLGPPQPPQPPQHYYDSLDFHMFGTSPILAYRHMFNSGYTYACTFPYSKYVTPYVPSPPDSYVRAHHPTTSYYPHGNIEFPYAEEYPHYLPHGLSHSYYPTQHFGVNLHADSFHPTSYRHIHDQYPFLGIHQPPVRVRPYNNPHAFHSVVNYGYINLHHGDHFEPHDNGKTIPHHAGYLPSPYFMEPPQHLGPKAGDDRNTSDSMKDVEISKEQKS